VVLEAPTDNNWSDCIAAVQLRETGRVIRAQVVGRPPDLPIDLKASWPGEKDSAWRFA
jgi:hypothetical protein